MPTNTKALQVAEPVAQIAGKNKIINGDFSVWQRGTSFTYTGYSPSYTADRFYYQTDATGGSPSYTVSQQTFTPGAAPVAGYEGTYYLRLACTTKGTTVSYSLFKSPIEDVRTLAGQTVTLSFWAKASSSTSFKTTCEQNFGSGGSGQVSEIGATTYTLTTSWVRYSTTFTMASVSGKTIGAGSSLAVVLNSTTPANGLNIDIWGVQLEAGSTATPFQTATGTIQGELAACQRYYVRFVSTGGGNPYFGQGTASAAAAPYFAAVLPTTMRTTPSVLDVSGLQIADATGATATLSNAAIDSGTSNPRAAVITATGTGLTVGAFYWFRATSPTGYIGFGAEL